MISGGTGKTVFQRLGTSADTSKFKRDVKDAHASRPEADDVVLTGIGKINRGVSETVAGRQNKVKGTLSKAIDDRSGVCRAKESTLFR